MRAATGRRRPAVCLRAATMLAAVLVVGEARAAEFSGQIVDDQTGEPVPAATVRVVTTGNGTATDDDGGFRFTDVPSGTIGVVVHHVGYRSWRRTLSPADNVVIRI